MASNILKGLTILLVDDERYSLQVFGRALLDMGNPEILFAENGAEALSVLSTCGKKIDMIISDFNMPTVHGLQLLKAVRVGVKDIDRATPFAMLTGYSDKRLVDMALALDVNGFLIKPASKEALSKRLAKLLAQTESDLWLKEVKNYIAIDVDGALNEIAKPDVEPERVRGFQLMSKNKALFRRSGVSKGKTIGASKDKTVGVEARGLPDNSGDDRAPQQRSQLKGRLCALGELPENSILARDVYTGDGRLFVHAGTELTPRIVSILDDLYDLDHPVKEIWIAI